MTHARVFAHPFTYWVGMDTDPRTTPEALAEFNRFYSTTHVHEVIAAHAGFLDVSRFELLRAEPGEGKQSGPRWLAVYGMADEAAAEQYIKDNQRPWLHRKQYSPWPPARKKARIVWRMLWRQVADTAEAPGGADSVRILGINAPVDGRPSGGSTRQTQHELYREFAHPAPGCPRFCLAFEPDVDANAGLDATPGQVVWDLLYRRIPLPG
jgi:hypothetical protein